MGTVLKFGTVGWSVLQMVNLDFPEAGIGDCQHNAAYPTPEKLFMKPSVNVPETTKKWICHLLNFP